MARKNYNEPEASQLCQLLQDIEQSAVQQGKPEKSSDSEAHEEDAELLRPSAFKTSISHLLCKFALYSLALWGGISLFLHLSPLVVSIFPVAISSNQKSRCWCGTSDAEALAIGCKYDHLAVDWLPAHCIDAELTAEFDRAGPGPDGAWDYFADPKGKQRLNLADIDEYAIRGKEYYTTRGWHIAHCAFTWRKQFRRRLTETEMETWNEHEEHIKHCGDYFMEDGDLGFVDTIVLGRDRHKREEKMAVNRL